MSITQWLIIGIPSLIVLISIVRNFGIRDDNEDSFAFLAMISWIMVVGICILMVVIHNDNKKKRTPPQYEQVTEPLYRQK